MATKGDILECGHDDCSTEFEVTHHLQKYCPEHRTTYTRRNPGAPDARKASRPCENPMCQKLIRGKRALNLRVKYCDDDCREQAQWTRANDRRRAQRTEEIIEESGHEPGDKARRGEVFDRLRSTGDGDRVLEGEVSHRALAEVYGVTPAAISRGMEAFRFWKQNQELADEWSWSWRVRALFPREKMERLREIGLELREDAKHDEEFNRLADELARAYAVYSRWYFRFKKKRVLIKGFHMRWIRAIIVAYGTGGKLYILSPPRHGKSEVLIRLFIWVIVMDPTIRIGWLAASKDIAKVMVGKVKAHLEFNEELIRDTLPPGEAYKPAWGSGKPWATYQFSVAQAPAFDQKSYTLTAFGRTSKILSLDFDMICVDDIEDFDTTREQDQRAYSKDKFLEFGTRKEEDTVWFGIGSRQHEEDIPGALLENQDQAFRGLEWEIIVDSAHDDNLCGLDPDEIEGHDSHGCVLFPEVRSYRWLMEKKYEEENLIGGGEQGRYEMRYLNAPRPTSGLVFNMEKIRQNALNHALDVGLEQLPPVKLIAGIDPASRGTQAAVLWGYANGTLYLVDMETQEAGGFEGARKLMAHWNDKYGVTDFIYEDNSQQVEFFNDLRFKELRAARGLNVRSHTTGKNKHDPELGISGMAPYYHDGTIVLPYGTAEARKKVNVLLNQLKVWTTDGVARKKGKTDVKMASWFPFPRIIRWVKIEREDMQTKVRTRGEPSYPMPTRAQRTVFNTRYPGR